MLDLVPVLRNTRRAAHGPSCAVPGVNGHGQKVLELDEAQVKLLGAEERGRVRVRRKG